MKHIIILTLLSSLFCLSSCYEQTTYEKGPIDLRIAHAAGADYAEMGAIDYYSAYPAPHGTMMDGDELIDVFVLGRAVDQDTEIGISPVEELTFVKGNGEIEKMIYAIPTDEALQYAAPDQFLNDSDKLYSIMHIVEYWYANKNGLNGSRLKSRRQVSHTDYSSN